MEEFKIGDHRIFIKKFNLDEFDNDIVNLFLQDITYAGYNVKDILITKSGNKMVVTITTIKKRKTPYENILFNEIYRSIRFTLKKLSICNIYDPTVVMPLYQEFFYNVESRMEEIEKYKSVLALVECVLMTNKVDMDVKNCADFKEVRIAINGIRRYLRDYDFKIV